MICLNAYLKFAENPSNSFQFQKAILAKALENPTTRTNRSSSVMIDQANRTLTFVPLVFICLRIWGTLRFLINTFDPNQELSEYFSWLAPLQVLSVFTVLQEFQEYSAGFRYINQLKRFTYFNCFIFQGIGDSSQGFANCVLFCLLSVRVRRRICRPCYRYCSRRSSVITPDIIGRSNSSPNSNNKVLWRCESIKSQNGSRRKNGIDNRNQLQIMKEEDDEKY